MVKERARIRMNWDGMKKKFKNFSLKKKLLVFYSVLFVLPLLLISILIYQEVSQSMMEKIQYSAEQSYEQAKSYLEYKMLMLIQRTDVVVVNSTLTDMIQERTAKETDIHQQMEQKEYIRSYLQGVEGNTQNIRIKVYVPDEFVYSADGDYIFPLTQADESPWYQKKGKQKIYFAPGIYLEEEYQERHIALVRDVWDRSGYQTRNGVLRMDIEVKELEDILWNATPTEHAVTYLINEEGIIVAASSQEKLAAIGLPEEFDLRESRFHDKKVYYMRDRIRNTDWEMITIIPKNDMISGIAKLQTMVAGMMVLFGVLTIAGGAAIISWIVRRISHLVDSINQVKEGNLDVRLENDSMDEIGVLYDNYNEMIERTSDLMDEQYRMGISLKSAELKALQSQINPHFLYNTLDTVNWLAYAGRTEEIHKAVVSLSKYYRLILNKGQDTLTLEEELRHVEYYMKIQDIRFPDKLTYEVDVKEEIKSSIVPKIILQPLVENAISHGIWEKKSKQGTIRVLGYEENDQTVCIKVMDDGVGMDADTLSKVMTGSIQTSGSSYGVKNVHARLQLMFGEEYGLSYESKEGEGTCVTIRIPHHRQ